MIGAPITTSITNCTHIERKRLKYPLAALPPSPLLHLSHYHCYGGRKRKTFQRKKNKKKNEKNIRFKRIKYIFSS